MEWNNCILLSQLLSNSVHLCHKKKRKLVGTTEWCSLIFKSLNILNLRKFQVYSTILTCPQCDPVIRIEGTLTQRWLVKLMKLVKEINRLTGIGANLNARSWWFLLHRNRGKKRMDWFHMNASILCMISLLFRICTSEFSHQFAHWLPQTFILNCAVFWCVICLPFSYPSWNFTVLWYWALRADFWNW